QLMGPCAHHCRPAYCFRHFIFKCHLGRVFVYALRNWFKALRLVDVISALGECGATRVTGCSIELRSEVACEMRVLRLYPGETQAARHYVIEFSHFIDRVT